MYSASTEGMLLAKIEEIDRANDRQVGELLSQHPTVWAALESLFDHLQDELIPVSEGMIPVLYETRMAGWRKKNTGT
ncbi:hypothetical protein [Cohnella sp. 56]|uniref:hypothetical protein n=1 Tax=Cohnella sp. 56 TaxID=3113722 RepID=UPI0030E81F25